MMTVVAYLKLSIGFETINQSIFVCHESSQHEQIRWYRTQDNEAIKQ